MAIGDITDSSGKVVRRSPIKKPSGGYYGGSSSSGSTGGSTSGSGTIPRTIVASPKESSITIETAGGVKTWKGDPTNTAAISAWKQSYEPGYKPQIISPRDSSGNYTSDPKIMVTHTIITKEQQAKEIAISLKGETKVPEGIIQYLQKVLLKPVQEKLHTNPPTAVTDTTRIAGNGTITSRLNTEFIGKISAVTIATFVIIFISLNLLNKK